MRLLKSTTALALVVSLSAPAPLMAQDLPFDPSGMSGEQILEEILRLRMSGEIDQETAEALQAEIEGAAGDTVTAQADQAQANADAAADAQAEADAAAAQAQADADAAALQAQQDAEAAAAQAEADAQAAQAQADQEAANAAAQAEADAQAAQAQSEQEAADADAQAEADAQPAEETAETGSADMVEEDGSAGEAVTDTMADGDAETDSQDVESLAQELENAQGASDDGAVEGAAAGSAETGDEADGATAGATAAGETDISDAEGSDSDAEATTGTAEADATGGETDAAESDAGATDAETLEERLRAAESGTVEAEGDDGEVVENALPQVVEESSDTDVAEVDSQTQANALAEQEEASTGSAAAAASSEDGDAAVQGEPEVTEETVTADTARSSSEEFETDIRGNAREADADDDDDDDNDDRDRMLRGAGAALLGLGALAIGSQLRNNENVVANTGDRVVIERDGQYRVLRDDNALLRQPGADLTTYRYDDGSTRQVVVREDGSEVETIRSADGRVLRRTRILPNGNEVVLFDDTQAFQQVVVNDLPQVDRDQRRVIEVRDTNEESLANALRDQQMMEGVDRTFSLNQVRNIDAVRELVPQINVDLINFATNSAVIQPQEAEELAALGGAIRSIIEENPDEVFLIEGHTDAVGAPGYNLALSDRRAESVALALTEYFQVPPENMIVQGYGESDLLISTGEAERANRRAAVRRITPLLQQQASR